MTSLIKGTCLIQGFRGSLLEFNQETMKHPFIPDTTFLCSEGVARFDVKSTGQLARISNLTPQMPAVVTLTEVPNGQFILMVELVEVTRSKTKDVLAMDVKFKSVPRRLEVEA